ncbi:DUF6461 domain-containing protein [Streptomyces humi]|uniref:DUF6461 domain-containing protein n=1 Tax=Streptomyces humi TaxID=1428620 RepID=UPI0006288977|nr:DUF6461 domain-containing protein [Streptomyces humi]
MSTTDTTVLRAGESLHLRSLVSPSGGYALEHRQDGTAVLRDRAEGRDLWHVGTPGTAPGQLVLHPEGRLVLEAWPAIPVWASGDIDRRAVAASVTDQGRLVLTDPDGGLRWSRDPLSAAELAAYRPAGGDRLLPGQVLSEPLCSPNGQYRLSHDPAGRTVLTAPGERMDRQIWSIPVQAPGRLTLGTDGILRTGTNSMALLRWTGRYRLDPTAVRVSAVVVRDRGDVVLLDENGAELHDSRTAAEEARLAALRRAEARRQAKEAAKPRRPAGTGPSRDWFDLLDLSEGPCTLTLVEHADEREVLRRLGVPDGTIRSTTPQDLLKEVFSDADGDMWGALAVRVDRHVVVVEPCGSAGVERAKEVSRGTDAIVYYLDFDGWQSLAWYRDGRPLARYGEADSDRLERGRAAVRGTERGVFVPFMEQIGVGVYREDEDDDFLPPAVEVACLAAGIRLSGRDFEGTHPGAVLESR